MLIDKLLFENWQGSNQNLLDYLRPLIYPSPSAYIATLRWSCFVCACRTLESAGTNGFAMCRTYRSKRTAMCVSENRLSTPVVV